MLLFDPKLQIRSKIQVCYFLKIFKVQSPDFFPKYFPLLEERITEEILITFPVSIPNTVFSEIPFYHQL